MIAAIRWILVAALSIATPHASSAQGPVSRLPILSDDGSPVLNHRVGPDRIAAAEKLPGAVVAANPSGDVTLVEFYDLNCPYCRRASNDIDALLRADNKLRLVLIPFPVLGVPSILAGRVEIAVSKSVTPDQFYAFHRSLYAGRGVIDGQRALAAATAMKLDQQKLIDAANDDGITEIMKSHVRFADTVGLKATPSYLIKDVAIQGHPGPRSLKAIVASVRACGKVIC